MRFLPSHPILDPKAAGVLEKALFEGDEMREWVAMQRAGRGLSDGIRTDLGATGASLSAGRVLVLAGKGHNAGDALIAAAGLLETYPECTVDVAFVFGLNALRPLAARAWRDLVILSPHRVRSVTTANLAARYTVVIDGLFGFGYRPPLPPGTRQWLSLVNAVPARLRAAVDLPSGLGEEGAFRADVTYATGSIKSPIVDLPGAGRIHWLDLGFFSGDEPGDDRALSSSVLEPLRALRPAHSDKRSYGHVFVLGGSRSYPGAVLMAVQAAVRAGAGLVTAFVPESLAPAFAAVCPEAMWQACPETSDGGLAVDSSHLVRIRLDRANAVLVGPGLGREPESLAVVTSLVREANVPVVLDADALQPQIVWSGSCPRILTPHAGEFQRVSNGVDLREFRPTQHGITVLKGPVTRISDGCGVIYHSFAGGPVLARGGSGDMLGGIIAALLAANPAAPLEAAARGVFWHGRAAEKLAEARGEVAVRATELLDYLGPALREE